MNLPVERILWAPTNSAHHNHLHVVGDPRMAQSELPTSGIWTPAIVEIVDALDARFGPGEHFIIDPDASWTHMGVYNPRKIAGTNIWSQHAGANAIDLGPYYGVEEQQKFYDFLTGKEEDMPLTDAEIAKIAKETATAVVSRVLTDSSNYADPPGLGRQVQLIRAKVGRNEFLLRKVLAELGQLDGVSIDVEALEEELAHGLAERLQE